MRWNDRKGGERGGIIILGGQMKGEGGRGETDHFMSNLPGRLYCLLLLLHELPLCTKYIDWSKLYHFTLSANQLLTSCLSQYVPSASLTSSSSGKFGCAEYDLCSVLKTKIWNTPPLKHSDKLVNLKLHGHENMPPHVNMSQLLGIESIREALT